MSEPHTAQPTPEPRPATRPPRHVPRSGRIAIVGVVGAALVAAVLITLTAVPAPLPEPRPLAHDPVPAGRIHWTIPADCGIGAGTLRALLPHPTFDRAGESGSCRWFVDPRTSGHRSLDVNLTPHHAGPGVPGAAEAGNSSIAAAITALNTNGAYQGSTTTPVTGLGDEAILSETHSSSVYRYEVVAFRTGNVTANVQYSAEAHPIRGKPEAAGQLRAGALRAAADVARHLGAPAEPKPVSAAAPPPAVHAPGSVCGVVPQDLRDRLLGGEDQEAEPGDATGDPSPGSLSRGAGDRTCVLRSDGRRLTVAITTGTTPAAVRDIGREYLRRYLDARAEKPLTGGDARYFHALSGLGDQAFCAYLEESSSVNDVESPARVVVRKGAALIAVVYGSDTSGYEEDAEPLSEQEAVDGAYAVAVRAAGAVRR